MRVIPLALAATLLTFAAQGAGAAVVSAVPTANISFGGVGVEPVGVSIRLPAVDEDGGFRGAASLVLCDGSVRQATACEDDEVLEALLSFSVQGSIFPFIDGAVSFLDAGAPTTITVSFASLIAPFAGPAVTGLVGSVTAPATRTAAAVEAAFPEGFITGGVGGPMGVALALASGGGPIPTGPDSPVTEAFGPLAGSFDCATVGGCNLATLQFGLKGLGDGGLYQISGRFDLDPAMAPVPLPASALLLLAGLGALGLARRRR
jgi:hypothetical protein